MTERSEREGGIPVAGTPPSPVPGAGLAAAFAAGPALIAYVPLGDPAAGDTTTLLDAYADAGVAVLEVGIPAADPWMDGPEVRESMARALAAGTTPATIAAALAAWRDRRGPGGPAIVWFGYPEIPADAIAAAASAGRARGALLLLAPWRHPAAATLPGILRAAGVARAAFLPWAATADDRAAAADADGYLMLQARPGVTGAGAPPALDAATVAAGRALAPGIPCVAGFGVAGPEDARALCAAGCDGVVIGSACIRALRVGGPHALHALLAPVAAALRAPAPVSAGAVR
ncbi:MAG: tryptophan synthase subunit alpha [Chloroflexota bacterium]